METARELLGHNLGRLRKIKKMTQGALAEAAGLSLKMIQKLEYGNSAASPETIDQLCEALGCLPSDLFAYIPAKKTKPANVTELSPATASRRQISEEDKTLLEVMTQYVNASEDRRLLAQYILTDDDRYRFAYENLPDAKPGLGTVLKKSLST